MSRLSSRWTSRLIVKKNPSALLTLRHKITRRPCANRFVPRYSYRAYAIQHFKRNVSGVHSGFGCDDGAECAGIVPLGRCPERAPDPRKVVERDIRGLERGEGAIFDDPKRFLRRLAPFGAARHARA